MNTLDLNNILFTNLIRCTLLIIQGNASIVQEQLFFVYIDQRDDILSNNMCYTSIFFKINMTSFVIVSVFEKCYLIGAHI